MDGDEECTCNDCFLRRQTCQSGLWFCYRQRKDGDNPVNQSKHEVITRSRHKARENVHARATIGFGFTSDWLKKWGENFESITE